MDNTTPGNPNTSPASLGADSHGTSTALSVSLRERSYPIHIGSNALDSLLDAVVALRRAGRAVFAVTSPSVAAAHPGLFDTLARQGVVVHTLAQDGETAKSIFTYARVLESLAQAGVDRSGVLLAIGGGVVGDLGGFAAASYLRGIAYYQVPTTLLAMVDSAVGGKTGVNLTAGKNLVGAFYQPLGVHADMRMLATLPPREFSAGVAEIIKYGLLGDPTLFATLQSSGPLAWNQPTLPAIIRRCCEIKATIVADDERETSPENGRALLNLGHTFGHAIEKTAGYGEYLHGEAVAIGLVLAARLSARLGFFDVREIRPIENLLADNNLPTHLRSPLLLDALLDAMRRDKKVRNGVLRFVLLRVVGASFTHTLEDTPDNLALLRTLWLDAGAGTIPA